MDGDSSTTDASQLGIAGDYISGSHYVLQSHEGDADEGLGDHDDTNGSKESYREQDIYLPIANVARIMKSAVPATGKAMKGEKGLNTSTGGGTDGLGEELTEETFSNQLTTGLITTDGPPQNVMVYTTSYQQISGVQPIQFS
ncbi:nuclear transcription factor Y subunit beta-like isoform X2 [Chiloscyllium punctatum]|uniref:nuclear transcription factor Y subunit beta-like isoform X3 n=1 Tax=Chiloscyllium plagiosum TaxID=36176 RepID=UPI001CB82BE2|nr:nuclear transcription factor Y subunit beta-like isoform X3 [Chiloscyllium plagiosum]